MSCPLNRNILTLTFNLTLTIHFSDLILAHLNSICLPHKNATALYLHVWETILPNCETLGLWHIFKLIWDWTGFSVHHWESVKGGGKLCTGTAVKKQSLLGRYVWKIFLQMYM